MNTSTAGAKPEELMVFPKTFKYTLGIKTTFSLICKGFHQNTLIKQVNTIIEHSYSAFSIYLV